MAAPIYDLTLLLDTAAPEDRRKAVLDSVHESISSAGSIVNEQDWGPRALAYEIRHKTDAEYHLLQFQGPTTLLEQLQRTLRITDEVLRFRIIKLAPGTPDAPETRPEPRPTVAGASGEVPAAGEPVFGDDDEQAGEFDAVVPEAVDQPVGELAQ
jgi:small subunit ribosomal protein S6